MRQANLQRNLYKTLLHQHELQFTLIALFTLSYGLLFVMQECCQAQPKLQIKLTEVGRQPQFYWLMKDDLIYFNVRHFFFFSSIQF
jgi:hypothetical protein